MTLPANFKFLEPWVEIKKAGAAPNRARELAKELEREVGVGHALSGIKAHAIAVRIDQDDVLFELEDGNKALAVVHLTWSAKTSSPYPRTKLFETWDHWVRESMRPDHEDYIFPEKPNYEAGRTG